VRDWIYCKVFARNPDDVDFHHQAIAGILVPFWESHKADAVRFFISRYKFERGFVESSGEEPVPESCYVKNNVAFLRIRLEVEQEMKVEILEDLLQCIQDAKDRGLILESEELVYDVDEDIGKRFGENLKEPVLDFLDAHSRILLELISSGEYDDQNGIRRVIDLYHLSGNILNFKPLEYVKLGNHITFLRDLSF